MVRGGPNAGGPPVPLPRLRAKIHGLPPKTAPVADGTKALSERTGVRAIARVPEVSRSWVQGLVNDLLRDHTTPPEPLN